MLDILEEQMEIDEIDFRLVTFILIKMGKLNDSIAVKLCLGNIDKLYLVF